MEINILKWINANLHGSNIINQIVKYITYLGDAGICWIALGLLLLCFPKTRKGGFIVVVGYCSVVAGNHFILKNIFNRPRPFTVAEELVTFIESIVMELPDSSSFPSGHTFTSFCSAIILTLVFKKKGAWSYIPATLISLSRIFLCVHYVTDVLAGAILGTICGILVYIVTNWLINKFITSKMVKQEFARIEKTKEERKKEEPIKPEDDEEKSEGEESDEEEKPEGAPVPNPASVIIE